MTTISMQQKNNTRSLNSTQWLSRVILVLIGCTFILQARSQADKRLVLADKYFDAGDYYTAAGLYGQFLNPPATSKTPSDFPLNSNRNAEGRTGKYGSRTNILFKQAESYRLANYWKEAAELYKKCYDEDPLNQSTALYWYSVCQRSMGNYTEAEKSINLFLNDHANGHPYRQAAEQEKQTLDFIRTQLSRPDTVLYQIQKLHSAFGNEKGFFAPAINDNRFMITSTQTETVAEGINPYHNRLFTSSLTEGGLQGIEPLLFTNLDSTFNQGTASISRDGSHLYFTQWKNENGKTRSAVYHSTKTNNGWSQPQLLPLVNQDGANSKQPFISTDGKFLFFASDRNGGQGGFDIWYATVNHDGTTGEAVNAGNILNTGGNEQSPFYHSATSTLVFSSDRKPGMGGYDLFMSTGSGNTWKAPENMGYPVNSSRDDMYFFSTGTNHILDNAYFSSDRGSECCLATYMASKQAKKKQITGIVRNCRDNEPVADAEVTIMDEAGNTMQTRTAADGSYGFAIASGEMKEISVKKELYEDTTTQVVIEGRNESAWHTDTLFNAALCIEKKIVLKVENVVTVYFEFDQSKLSEQAMLKLDSVYAILLEDTTANLQISGYTDGLGSEAYNKKLSDRRAKACADYLVQKGIEASRISFESFGACCPVEMEMINGRDNPDGRSLNRRALLNIDRRDSQ